MIRKYPKCCSTLTILIWLLIRFPLLAKTSLLCKAIIVKTNYFLTTEFIMLAHCTRIRSIHGFIYMWFTSNEWISLQKLRVPTARLPFFSVRPNITHIWTTNSFQFIVALWRSFCEQAMYLRSFSTVFLLCRIRKEGKKHLDWVEKNLQCNAS